eukprot:TRINITY_DN5956_c0_g2_i5.p2 TRINITY_DN5956_c0_g2~~TRINITY_DN5956_c0_g2_i5.p2  ORF type:complete len:130 (-),score=11.34 TRINITY_DN5956_c0_g2_i5:306-695(-)
MCSIFAVQFIGLAVGQGVWSGSGMLVSFLWGALYFKEPLTNPGLAALAIIVLLLATVGVGSAPIGPVPRLIRKLRGIPEPAPTIDTETTQTTTGAPSPDDPVLFWGTFGVFMKIKRVRVRLRMTNCSRM